jgi:hypothetical protein
MYTWMYIFLYISVDTFPTVDNEKEKHKLPNGSYCQRTSLDSKMNLPVGKRLSDFLIKRDIEKTVIPWNLIKCEGLIKESAGTKICWQYFFKELVYNEGTIDALSTTLSKARRDVRQFVYPRVKEAILEVARGKSLMCKGNRMVGNYGDLCTYWKEISTEDECKLVWDCVIGVFELRRTWKMDLEHDVLEHFGWEFDPETVVSEGSPANSCIAKIISRVINDVRKNMNSLKKRHMFELRVKRRPEDINERNKTKRRKKGQFVSCTAVLSLPTDETAADTMLGVNDDEESDVSTSYGVLLCC